MWVAQHFHYDYPGQLLTSGGFGTMGFGLGAAIGAKVGNPEKTVVHITGDGSFRMNCNELATEQYYKLPIITIIYNMADTFFIGQLGDPKQVAAATLAMPLFMFRDSRCGLGNSGG